MKLIKGRVTASLYDKKSCGDNAKVHHFDEIFVAKSELCGDNAKVHHSAKIHKLQNKNDAVTLPLKLVKISKL